MRGGSGTPSAFAGSGAARHRVLLLYLVLCVMGGTPGHSALGTADASAQGLWTEATTLGYTALGLGIAVAAITAGDCGGCALGAGIGVVGGGLGFGIGNIIGSSAESAARLGERPSAAQLLGVRVGTVLAGASLGAAVGGVYINRKWVRNPGEDERDLVVLAVLGAAVGAWIEYRQEAWLRGTRSDLTPVVRRTLAGRTEVGLRLSTP